MKRRRAITHVEEELGSVLGDRYRLDALLGSGATGDVFRATALDTGRPVALKILDGGLWREKRQIDRFKREAEVCSRLRHPHIVRVHEYGRFPDGRLYLAMEHLEGETLGARLRRAGSLTLLEACAIVRQTAEGLVEAHHKGIVHRDLKPDNLFLARQGGSSDFVKVLDFGIARFVGDQAIQETLTRSGFVAGTPLYLSPEQGRGKLVDPRSDLYTLGVVLYELVVGRPPFVGESPIALVMQHVKERPPSPALVNPGLALPPRLTALIEALLAKDRDARPASAAHVAAVLADIEDELAAAPTLAPPRQPDSATHSGRMAALARLHALPSQGVEGNPKELRELARVLRTSLGTEEKGLPVVEVDPTAPRRKTPTSEAVFVVEVEPSGAIVPAPSPPPPPPLPQEDVRLDGRPRRNRRLGLVFLVLGIAGLVTWLVLSLG